MEIRWFIGVAAAALLATVSCGPRATPEECIGACRNYDRLMAVAEAERNRAALEAIDLEQKSLEAALERELQALDDEADRMLDLVEDDDERAALIEEYEARVEAKQSEFQPRFEMLEEARALGHGAADEEEVLAGCTDRCLEGRTGKHTADCRANAVDLAEFQMCR